MTHPQDALFGPLRGAASAAPPLRPGTWIRRVTTFGVQHLLVGRDVDEHGRPIDRADDVDEGSR